MFEIFLCKSKFNKKNEEERIIYPFNLSKCKEKFEIKKINSNFDKKKTLNIQA